MERKKKDTCLILHDAITPLTTLLASEIKRLPRYRKIYFFFNLKDVRFHLISFLFFPSFFLYFSLILQVNPRDNRILFEVFDENRLVSTGFRH